MRAGIVLLMLQVTSAVAQEARPTIHYACNAAGCSPLQTVPEVGAIDLVILNAVSRPTVTVRGQPVALRECATAPTIWCATNVAVAALAVRGLGAPDPIDGGSVQTGDSRTDTPPIRVSTTGDRVMIDLVGRDASTVPRPPEAPATLAPPSAPRSELAGPVVEVDEYFEDVVLVGDQRGFRCSGVMIAPRHVLSAAHCAPATIIGVGNSMADAVRVAVTRTTRHPTADVAVLEVAVPASIAPRPRRRDRHAGAPLGVTRILGFGVSDQLHLTGFGRKHSFTVPIDGWGCNEQRARELGCVIGRELLLRGGRGHDTCLGDSGGPLFELTPDGWQLVGITSRGTHPRQLLCGEGGIYSRVDVLSAWIDEVIKP